jgi:hypothetical protein
MVKRSTVCANEGPPASTRTQAPQVTESNRLPSGSALDLSLLDDALVRFVRTFDAILPLVTLRRKKLCDFIHTARSKEASGARRITDGLADIELVIAQMVLRVANASIYCRDGTR